MMKIVTGKDQSVLRAKAKKVEVFDEALKKIVAEMTETMLCPDKEGDVQGIGLAANQVGLLQQIMIVTFNVGTRKKRKIVPMINPEILEFFPHKISMEEGCLSLPSEYGDVVRPSKIKVTWCNEQGNRCEKKLEGWDARIFQHEYDHLKGILFIDYLNKA